MARTNFYFGEKTIVPIFHTFYSVYFPFLVKLTESIWFFIRPFKDTIDFQINISILYFHLFLQQRNSEMITLLYNSV